MKRSDHEMENLILSVAQKDERIRAVLVSGSRTNTKIVADHFQDFDIVYLVRELESFLIDPLWIDVFGERLIMQTPDDMPFLEESVNDQSRKSFAYLMQFKDGNRIDLTLYPVENHLESIDSLSRVLLDKDGIFPDPLLPNDLDYQIQKPSQSDFDQVCNEFWWLCPYVAKGLCRGEITYAKAIMEGPMRHMFLLMAGWHVGISQGYEINIGAHGRFLQSLLSPTDWNDILETYPGVESPDIWTALHKKMRLFLGYQTAVGKHLSINTNMAEAKQVITYLKMLQSQC